MHHTVAIVCHRVIRSHPCIKATYSLHWDGHASVPVMLFSVFVRRCLNMRFVSVLHFMTQLHMGHVILLRKIVLTSNREFSGYFVCLFWLHSILVFLAINIIFGVTMLWSATCMFSFDPQHHFSNIWLQYVVYKTIRLYVFCDLVGCYTSCYLLQFPKQ